MELEWSVHKRVVSETSSLRELPGKVGVQTFVVTHDTRLQIHEACQNSDDEQPNDKNPLDAEWDRKSSIPANGPFSFRVVLFSHPMFFSCMD
jgi:hypothetical protein